MNVLLGRLHKALDLCNIPSRGRVKEVCGRTGYSQGMVSKILTGKVEMADKFLKLVCGAFRINISWILEGKEPVLLDSIPITSLANDFPLQAISSPQGKRLMVLRESLFYTVEEMAGQLNISIDTLQEYEKALFIKDMNILTRLSMLCINIKWLLVGTGEMRLKEWPIVISKDNAYTHWNGRTGAITYKIDDLFTTRLKRTLAGKSIEKLSSGTQIRCQRVEAIITDKTIPTVDELEAISKFLGNINPRWLAEKSCSQEEDWEFELFRGDSAGDLPYNLYNLCESAINDYLVKFSGLIKLSPFKINLVIGALGRVHLKDFPGSTEINQKVLKTLIDHISLVELLLR